MDNNRHVIALLAAIVLVCACSNVNAEAVNIVNYNTKSSKPSPDIGNNTTGAGKDDARFKIIAHQLEEKKSFKEFTADINITAPESRSKCIGGSNQTEIGSSETNYICNGCSRNNPSACTSAWHTYCPVNFNVEVRDHVGPPCDPYTFEKGYGIKKCSEYSAQAVGDVSVSILSQCGVAVSCSLIAVTSDLFNTNAHQHPWPLLGWSCNGIIPCCRHSIKCTVL